MTEIVIIITSRKVGYQETSLGGNFNHYEINDFNEEQINAFAKNWYISIAEESDQKVKKANEKAINLFQSITQNESILRLARNPLLMTIIALIYHQGSSLPERRIELYDIATATFLENWVKRRKNTESILFDKYTIKDVLFPIAFYIHNNYSDSLIIESEFRKKIIEEYSELYGYKEDHKIIENVNKLIEFLREDAGFIFEKGITDYSEGKFGFIHHTFQEYFTALEFVVRWKQERIGEEFKEYIFSDNWHEVILLTASLFRQTEQTKIGKQKATKFVKEILSVEDEFPELHRKLKLTLKIFNDEVLIDIKKFQEILDEALSLITFDDSEVYGRTENSNIASLISNLLTTKTYRSPVLERLKKIINTSKNETLTNKAISILTQNSEINEVEEYLRDLINNKYDEFKHELFSPNTISLLSPINKTKCYRTSFIRYLNEEEIDPDLLVELNFAFSFLPSDGLKFNHFNFDYEELINNYIDALKQISHSSNREILADSLVGIFINAKNERVVKYRDKLIEENVDVDLSKINKQIKRFEKVNHLGVCRTLSL